MTPAFPTRWPATKGTTLLKYAYARGFSPALREGEYTAAPWAILRIEGENLEFSPVGPVLELGIQGVRPLRFDDVDQPSPQAVESEFRELVRAGLPPRAPPRFRAAYQTWRSSNGVIAEVVMRLQPGFFDWLG